MCLRHHNKNANEWKAEEERMEQIGGQERVPQRKGRSALGHGKTEGRITNQIKSMRLNSRKVLRLRCRTIFQDGKGSEWEAEKEGTERIRGQS